MKLIEIISQHRRDFKGKYKCEGCGNIEQDKSMDSYDDRNFHDNVIPNRKCEKCGKSTIDLGIVPQCVNTKYPEGMQV